MERLDDIKKVYWYIKKECTRNGNVYYNKKYWGFSFNINPIKVEVCVDKLVDLGLVVKKKQFIEMVNVDD